MPTKEQFINEALQVSKSLQTFDQCSVRYELACVHLRSILVELKWVESLSQLVLQGPIWDGDIISKVIREYLTDFKLATRICVKGEQGFTAANYIGKNVLDANVVLYEELQV